ncbi:uncharacterized protein LOC106076435 [Biomphalaria glabrata]|uniref:Uncharacterized protein LOC106076435 n=2 Tax=Biomphalaria glabrata TaxID=6526 RepID=A0A9W2YQZ2_BIOGL|nr:uncharacterized protein LOC106076435 [Biomphalaria glabrata]
MESIFHIQFIVGLSIFNLDLIDCHKTLKLSMCPAEDYDVGNGKLMLKGVVSYKLKCHPGHAAPWGYQSPTFSFSCKVGMHGMTVPRGCIKFTFAQRRVSYNINLMGVTNNANATKLCSSDLISIESTYNETVQTGSTSTLTRGYFSDCHVLNNSVQVEMMLIDLPAHGGVTENVSQSEWQLVLRSYAKLKPLFSEYVTLQPVDVSKGPLPEITSATVHSYYCKENFGYRQDGHLHICVGCGRGWWMNTQTQTCHPCGPGYYNDEESATDCKVCEVRFLYAPWASISLDDCFPRESKPFDRSKHKALVFPFVFILILIIILVLGSKFLVGRRSEYRTST